MGAKRSPVRSAQRLRNSSSVSAQAAAWTAALAVSTPQRSSALPDVPTTLEAGYKNSDYTFWTGLFVPAKTPREIVDKLAQETQKALAAPGVR